MERRAGAQLVTSLATTVALLFVLANRPVLAATSTNFVLDILPGGTECSDGIDNDNDSLLDIQDPDCASLSDTSEAPPQVVTPPVSGGSSGGGSFVGGFGPMGVGLVVVKPIEKKESNKVVMNLSGWTSPGATVRLLKNAEALADMTADRVTGRFAVSTEVEKGETALFVVFSVDTAGGRSVMLTRLPDTQSAKVIDESNIILSPSIVVESNAEGIKISGRSVPGSTITLQGTDVEGNIASTIVSESGDYVMTPEWSALAKNAASVSVKAGMGSAQSVSSQTRYVQREGIPEACKSEPDLNLDGQINLVDFSIMLYQANARSTDTKYDLNCDGVITLGDFSVLAHSWSG